MLGLKLDHVSKMDPSVIAHVEWLHPGLNIWRPNVLSDLSSEATADHMMSLNGKPIHQMRFLPTICKFISVDINVSNVIRPNSVCNMINRNTHSNHICLLAAVIFIASPKKGYNPRYRGPNVRKNIGNLMQNVLPQIYITVFIYQLISSAPDIYLTKNVKSPINLPTLS